jgi:hypothetical protein
MTFIHSCQKVQCSRSTKNKAILFCFCAYFLYSKPYQHYLNQPNFEILEIGKDSFLGTRNSNNTNFLFICILSSLGLTLTIKLPGSKGKISKSPLRKSE